ncbi:hypothetical protein [Chryseobacterium sp. SG20098]|uniref:tyrosine-type recombinase/integrase n=1 Tax=Chryseobacterium sp. SG20098 TaxID=3074145 RepID=UPI0028830554|nr:hypothetical protein [Chryseobacterium sp. SG20098]WNI34702.1 hypothetical protein RHP76_11965 [Chryseobacterium sp. SG20098]
MKRRNTERIKLSNGCTRTGVYFLPKDCMDFTAKDKYPKEWAVECRFYDPRFKKERPNGKQYRKKFTKDSLKELRIFAEIYKEEMERKLDELFYNPITKSYMNTTFEELNPDLLFIDALWKVRDKMNYSEDYISLSRQLLNLIEGAIPKLGYSDLKINETEIFHMKNILEKIYTTESVFNKHRSCLKNMFDELLEYGCVKFNPISSLKKKVENTKERVLYKDDREVSVVLQYLHDKYPTFYRYTNIFRYSGGRSTELFRVQKKHVDINNQEYKVLIKKRKKYEWVTKIIIPVAIPYWKRVLIECKSEDDFLFSKDLRPGPVQIDSKQIDRRWRTNVKLANDIIDPITKKAIKIEVNFYTWKHMFLDKLDELQNNAELAPIVPINLAQGMANHLSPETTGKYTLGKQNRNNEYLKKIDLK